MLTMQEVPTSRLLALTVCLVAPLFVIAGATAAQTGDSSDSLRADSLLSAVPGEVAAAVMVRNLAELDGKLTDWSRGKDDRDAGSALEFAKASLELVAGVDDSAGAALVLMPPSTPAGLANDLALIVPTRDRDLLLAFLNPQPVGEGTFRVRLRGRESYAATKGRFTVFGPNLDVVRRVVSARGGLDREWSPYARSQWERNDACVWGSAVTHALNGRFDEVGGLRTAWLQAMFAGVTGARSALQCCAHLDSSGVRLEIYHPQRAGGRNRGLELANGGPADEVPLAGLPDEAFVCAMTLGRAQPAEVAGYLSGLLLGAANALGLTDPGRSTELLRRLRSVYLRIRSASVSVSALPGSSNGLIAVTAVVSTVDDTSLVVNDIDNVLSVFERGVFVDGQHNRVAERIRLQRGHETADDITVHRLMLLPPQGAADKWSEATALVDAEGVLARIAILDAHRLVIATGGGTGRFKEIVALARSGRAPLAAREEVAQARRNLQPGRGPQIYVAPARFISMVNSASRALGAPTEFTPWADGGPPVTLTLRRIEQGGDRLDLFVPAVWTHRLAVLAGLEEDVATGHD